MEFLLHAIEEKLAHVDEERARWSKYKDEHIQAEKNLNEFRKSFRKEILVPIGTKALMPGALYHTNEIFVGMCNGLFVKCSTDKALEVCQHRLTKSTKHLEALHMEYKMYKDRLELPAAEDAFGNLSEAQEIVEEYNEEVEFKWREQHKLRMREHKKREAEERRQVQADDNEFDIAAILEQAEIMEEFENELEELNVDNDEQLKEHLTTVSHELANVCSSVQAVDDTPIVAKYCNGVKNYQNGTANETATDEETETETDSDEILPKEFVTIRKAADNLSDADKAKFYEKHLRQIDDQLVKKNFTKIDNLHDLADKRETQECLQNAIEELTEGNTSISSDGNTNEAPVKSDVSAHEKIVCPSSPGVEGRKRHTRDEFNELECKYNECSKSKSELLVFYKSQLRNTMKSIASCTIDANSGNEMEEKRELYEYLSDRIDQLRAEILKEKQIKLEEKFVDDETDIEDLTVDDDECAVDLDNEDDTIEGANTSDTTCGNLSTLSPSKRKICFAPELSSVTTYHLDDEPWRVQSSTGQNAENVNNLIDATFQFFNSPTSSSASSVCGDDNEDDLSKNINKNDYASLKLNEILDSGPKNSTNRCDDNEKQSNESTININKNCDANDRSKSISNSSVDQLTAGPTLLLQFTHSSNLCTAVASTNNTINSPIDIYRQFGAVDGSIIYTNANTTELKHPNVANGLFNESNRILDKGTKKIDEKSELEMLKEYVLKVASLDASAVTEKMKQVVEGRKAARETTNKPSGLEKLPAKPSQVPNATIKPKKSILKNKDAVKSEIHGKVYNQIEDGTEESLQTFYIREREDPLIGFDQVLGDVFERVENTSISGKKPNQYDDDSIPSKNSANLDSFRPKKHVSLFKLNRMS